MPLFRTHKQRLAFQQVTHVPKASPRFIPIPFPQPVNCTLPLTAILGSDEVKAIQDAGKIVFHAVGDTGGTNGTDTEEAVATAMEAQFTTTGTNPAPSFFYHLGDVIYYNGQSALYEAQFYEPYKFYPAVIFAIPGNHDGDTLVQSGDLPDTEPSLYGFRQNFCAAQRTPISTYRDFSIFAHKAWLLWGIFATPFEIRYNFGGYHTTNFLGRKMMTTRSEILNTLAASQEQVTAYFRGLSPEDLERPCTASGVPGAAPWRAKDHFAHLAQNERNIQILLRLTLKGETSLPGGMGGAMSREERLAASNRRNQDYVDAHHDDSMETLFADVAAARQETLDLLAQFTDEQLAAPASISFVGDRTAGDLFAANAQHAAAHIHWIEEGLRQEL
ncbi:MAG TPA: DinB family protein [Ktedonobacteraceae bacterium]|nr:DinB family protein [Ktedonobacteraceae bacterium]